MLSPTHEGRSHLLSYRITLGRASAPFGFPFTSRDTGSELASSDADVKGFCRADSAFVVKAVSTLESSEVATLFGQARVSSALKGIEIGE
ncbi:hypothetical protein H6P81_015605 [Aristolochia fimbriata]|uniref:Uncharacterized protein n=1 Tax=Aristolochia fimbriata TaxID=158543 RepID=A0AAV7E838_ARIFI|nr:hypothetical protein H6P81_015605 [Aristolochia fimbriata]